MFGRFRRLTDPSRFPSLIPLLVALFFAPLAFGCATSGTMWFLDCLLASAFSLWLVGLVIGRRRPQLPMMCVGVLGFLTVWSVVSLANPKYSFDLSSWTFIESPNSIGWLPGTVDATETAAVVRHLAALLLGFIVLLDAVADNRSRWILLQGMALATGVVAVIGIFQRTGGAGAMLWTTPERSGGYFFAAFRYHGNAASFLLLGIPCAFAVWIRSLQTPTSSFARSMWLVVLLLSLFGIFVNTSKAGQFLALPGVCYLFYHFRKRLPISSVSKPVAAIIGVVLVSSTVIFILPGVAASIDRWGEMIEGGGSLSGRLLAYEACLKVLPDSGWLGTGPGTFPIVFPFYTDFLGDSISGFWMQAHQDYLQTLIEWGYLGTAGWVFLFAGAFVYGAKRVRRSRRRGRLAISDHCSLVALALVLLHALVDFPFQIASIQFYASIHLALLWNTYNSGKAGRAGQRHEKTDAGEGSVS